MNDKENTRTEDQKPTFRNARRVARGRRGPQRVRESLNGNDEGKRLTDLYYEKDNGSAECCL